MSVELENHTGTIEAVDTGADPMSSSRELAHGDDEEVDKIAVAVRGRLNRVRQEIVAIGRDLHRAKALLKRGQWMPWLRAEFGMSVRTAENYMNVAERLGEKFVSLASLRLETAYKLAARSTPCAVVEAVLARASSGEGLSDADAAAMLPKAGPPRSPRPAPATAPVATDTLIKPKPPVDPLNDWTTQASALLTTQIKEKARLRTLTHLLPRCDIELLVAKILDYLAPAS